MDKTDNNNRRKAVHKPKQPPPYQPVEAPPLNIVTFSSFHSVPFRPISWTNKNILVFLKIYKYKNKLI